MSGLKVIILLPLCLVVLGTAQIAWTWMRMKWFITVWRTDPRDVANVPTDCFEAHNQEKGLVFVVCLSWCIVSPRTLHQYPFLFINIVKLAHDVTTFGERTNFHGFCQLYALTTRSWSVPMSACLLQKQNVVTLISIFGQQKLAVVTIRLFLRCLQFCSLWPVICTLFIRR